MSVDVSAVVDLEKAELTEAKFKRLNIKVEPANDEALPTEAEMISYLELITGLPREKFKLAS